MKGKYIKFDLSYSLLIRRGSILSRVHVPLYSINCGSCPHRTSHVVRAFTRFSKENKFFDWRHSCIESSIYIAYLYLKTILIAFFWIPFHSVIWIIKPSGTRAAVIIVAPYAEEV